MEQLYHIVTAGFGFLLAAVVLYSGLRRLFAKTTEEAVSVIDKYATGYRQATPRGMETRTDYVLCFQNERKRVMKFRVNRWQYGAARKGQRGILKKRGPSFISFTPQ